MIPVTLREAALALGVSYPRTVLKVILPSGLSGIVTGTLLAVARGAGETAPLLFTALGNRFWSTAIDQPIGSLTVFIYDYSKAPFEDWIRQAWGAAFVLIALIFILSVIFRIVTRSRYAEH